MLTYDLFSFQHNVVVVTQQPQVVQPIRRTGNSDYGTPALVFAIGVTMFIVFFGCWWSLICSIAGIIFAANVSVVMIRMHVEYPGLSHEIYIVRFILLCGISGCGLL